MHEEGKASPAVRKEQSAAAPRGAPGVPSPWDVAIVTIVVVIVVIVIIIIITIIVIIIIDINININNGAGTCTSHAGSSATSTTALILNESLPHDPWGAECPG